MTDRATSAQLDAFVSPPVRIVRTGGRSARPRVEPDSPDRARLRARLEVCVLASAKLFGDDGFMLSDVRAEAVGRAVLTGHEGRPDVNTGRLTAPRELAWLGDLLPAMARRGIVERVTIAGRVQYGQSNGERAHGNKQVLWRLTDRGRALAAEMTRSAGAVTVADAEKAIDALADRRP